MKYIFILFLLIPNVLFAEGMLRGQCNASLYYHNDTGYTRTFDSSNIYYRIEPTSTQVVSAGPATAQTTSTIIIGYNGSGNYMVGCRVSFDGVASNTYEVGIFVNEVEQFCINSISNIGTANDTQHLSPTCIITLNDGDEVSARAKNVGATGAMVIYRFGLFLSRQGK